MLKWITNFTRKIENQAAEGGIVYSLASQYYKEVIQKEVVLANITENDHVLCIGGGICPFSAILIHQITGAKVTVIDNNTTCIPRAKQVINRLGIHEHVRVLCQDGSSAALSLSAYTVVHLALQVSPMDSVFSHIEKHVIPGTRLLVRRPKKQLNYMYSRFFDAFLAFCPYTTHKSRNISSTLLYIKQGQAEAAA